MSPTVPTGLAQPPSGSQRKDELAEFGYRQELRRTLGGFSAFAAGFSFVSILTTVFQLFAFGYSFGGTLFFWTWPVVIAGQLMVALNFAELASRYPLAGSVYQWAKHLAGGLLMAAPSLTDGNLAGQGLPYVITAVFGDTFGRIFLADVAIAVVVCTLTIQAGTIRLFYSMARDGALPCSRRLSRVNSRTGTPIAPAVVSGVLAIALLLLNLGNSTLFATVTATSVVLVYFAYLLVTAPLLGKRLRKQLPAPEPGWFSLGRWVLPVNIAAVAYGAAMIVNIAWPRAEIYDLAGTGSVWMLLFPVEFVAAALLVGWLCWRRLRGPVP